MTFKFWAKRRSTMVGPFATRDEALDAFRIAYPIKGKDYQANATKNDITTGYGEFGPQFSIQWAKARA